MCQKTLTEVLNEEATGLRKKNERRGRNNVQPSKRETMRKGGREKEEKEEISREGEVEGGRKS